MYNYEQQARSEVQSCQLYMYCRYTREGNIVHGIEVLTQVGLTARGMLIALYRNNDIQTSVPYGQEYIPVYLTHLPIQHVQLMHGLDLC